MSRAFRHSIAALIALCMLSITVFDPANAGETSITKPKGNGFIIFTGFGDNGR